MYSFVDQSNCTFMVHVVGAVYVCMFCQEIYILCCIDYKAISLCSPSCPGLKWLNAVKTPLGCNKLFTQFHLLADDYADTVSLNACVRT